MKEWSNASVGFSSREIIKFIVVLVPPTSALITYIRRLCTFAIRGLRPVSLCLGARWVIFCRLHDQPIHHLCAAFRARVTSTDTFGPRRFRIHSAGPATSISITPRVHRKRGVRVCVRQKSPDRTTSWHQHFVTITSLRNGHCHTAWHSVDGKCHGCTSARRITPPKTVVWRQVLFPSVLEMYTTYRWLLLQLHHKVYAGYWESLFTEQTW